MSMTTQAKLDIPKQPDTQFLWGWQYHQVIGIIWISGSSNHRVIDDYDEEDATPSSHLNHCTTELSCHQVIGDDDDEEEEEDAASSSHLNHRTTKSSWQFGSAETS